jgi:hypothetical protein
MWKVSVIRLLAALVLVVFSAGSTLAHFHDMQHAKHSRHAVHAAHAENVDASGIADHCHGKDTAHSAVSVGEVLAEDPLVSDPSTSHECDCPLCHITCHAAFLPASHSFAAATTLPAIEAGDLYLGLPDHAERIDRPNWVAAH